MRVTNLTWCLRLVCILITGSTIFVLFANWLFLNAEIKRQQYADITMEMQSWRGGRGAPSLKIRTSTKRVHKLKDWHDYKAIQREAQRKGVGEYGRAARIINKKKFELEKRLMKENGYNALLSDIISVNRSVPDVRHKACRHKKYIADLPAVSIIIPFFNEHFSALARTLHSITLRTPPSLIHEIILVDDASDRHGLGIHLGRYVKEHFPKVDLMRLLKRKGLIAARLAGALKASASVLVFLDAHVEVNYNWLPPLLEPIVKHNRTAVCPMIDVIDEKTLEYGIQDEGGRGAFDWNFDYKRLPLLPEDLEDPTEPFNNPIMAGGLFAIPSEFFWELGGYDEGLEVWGGEQYELSFKIWMCGGRLLDAPCSHVGHIFRGEGWGGTVTARTDDYVHKNYKRVAEVWMDEYKDFIYDRAAGVYDKIDEGDLTTQKALRDTLHCRSFKWFMENVAFDVVKHYPPTDIKDIAWGQLRCLGAEDLCLDALGDPDYQPVSVDNCDTEHDFPQRQQDWALTGLNDLRLRGEEYCLATDNRAKNAPVKIFDCHKEGGRNQSWYYDIQKQWLIYGENGLMCMEAKPTAKRVVINQCKDNNAYMKWSFVHINKTAIEEEHAREEYEYEEEH